MARGPSSVLGSSLWPMTIFSISSLISWASRSCDLRGTMARLSMAQTWPLMTVMVRARTAAASSSGKSSRTMAADLPPSSMV